jgi:hypothetical protein
MRAGGGTSGAPQAGLVYALNPVIQGWANYYQYCVAKHDLQILDNILLVGSRVFNASHSLHHG